MRSPRAMRRTVAELRGRRAETVAAMESGADVVFQATFFDGRWRGHADFLVRNDERPSGLGVVELRHRRHEARAPGQGGGDHPDVRLRRSARRRCRASRPRPSPWSPATASPIPTAWRTTPRTTEPRRHASRRACSRGVEPPATYPEPVDHCRVCTWWSVCIGSAARRRSSLARRRRQPSAAIEARRGRRSDARGARDARAG